MKLGTLLRLSDVSVANESFKKLSDMGFRACQLVYKPEKYCIEDAFVIKAAAERYGVEIAAQFCGYYDNATVWDNYEGFRTSGLNVQPYAESRFAYVCAAAEFACAAGAEDIVVHGGFVPNNPFSEEYKEHLDIIRRLAEYLRGIGMNLLLETGGESSVALLRMILDSGCDNIFVNLDPANMIMYGYANPVDSLYTIGKYVRCIHGKDGVPPTETKKLGDEKRVGEGMVDFPKMFAKLYELGYDRYVIIEREIAGDEQIADIVHAKRYFENVLTQVGYTVE